LASLSKEKNSVFRIHWKFRVRAGARAGEVIEGSLQLGRCTRAAAKAELRKIDEWQERVATGRLVPDQALAEVCEAWFRERELACTPQTVVRDRRVLRLYLAWRKNHRLPSATVAEIANEGELTRWRNDRLDHEAGRKTVASDLSTLSMFLYWCRRQRYLLDNPVERITRPRFEKRKEGTPLTRVQAGRWLRSIQSHRAGNGAWNEDDVRRKRQIGVFLLNTGLRNGELCGLNVEDLRIDAEERLVYVMGKGLKQRWVPLNRAAQAAARLGLRAQGNPRKGPVFVTRTGRRYNERQLASEISQTAPKDDDAVP